MLDLKAKLLAAGLVTAEQVKKVEDEEKNKRERTAERDRLRREGKSQARGPRERERRGGEKRDADERRAARDHREEEAQRWRKRLDALKASGKSEQYDAVRGWVLRHRLDDKTAVPSEGASRFHFARENGTIGHVTLEPDVQSKLAQGEAGIVAFMGYNGIEHAVVPSDLAKDIAHVKPEWLRSLAGVTDSLNDVSGSTEEPPPAAAPEGHAEPPDGFALEAEPATGSLHDSNNAES